MVLDLQSFNAKTMSVIPVSHHDPRVRLQCPYVVGRVPAGFPSPAEDHIEEALDLNDYLIRHPAATYYCRVSGHSMEKFGILDGCLLVVDRAVEPVHQSIILAVLDGEFTCKQWDKHNRQLVAGNDGFPPIPIPPGAQLESEGVVIHAINTYVSAR